MKLSYGVFNSDYYLEDVGYVYDGHHRLTRMLKKMLSKARRADNKKFIEAELIIHRRDVCV